VQSGLALYDVYVPEENLVVEIDGSTHFYGLTDRLLPRYVVKRKLLERAGVDVLYIEHLSVLDKNSEVRTDLVVDMVKKRLDEKRA
jgi:very-short-patch-repair endonuclease